MFTGVLRTMNSTSFGLLSHPFRWATFVAKTPPTHTFLNEPIQHKSGGNVKLNCPHCDANLKVGLRQTLSGETLNINELQLDE